MSILITGGAGYIGSHTCIELLESGFDIVVVDNLCNSSREAMKRVEALTGKSIPFYEADIRNPEAMTEVFKAHQIEAVIHFAGLKAVGESTRIPRTYYDNNVTGTLKLVEVMEQFNVHHLVFSSSATVYGDPAIVPITEDMPTGATTNPYGRSKYIVEEMLKDISASDNKWNFTLLRYFNPVGSHESGQIGEDPKGIPNNLMPFIAQVAVGKREQLSVFGDDYDTKDGTGVRDYIHVVDLAQGHVAAVKTHQQDAGLHIYNLGSGTGSSVLEMLQAFEKSCGKSLPYSIQPRRPGDIAECYADPSFAEKALSWKASRTVETMTDDTWRWQSGNPNGYES
ncbi:UDP-glucose 4-epimerase GalE [Endozoicomonas sp. OPT23]|uniref:UDP-glucose 4-epimerase GalE n=1 Tax=Endozoicomonas sp. OPT23 TaxID=2072845 RepID=UPI00129A90AF|nr:UDP-glucose 4-epimerase GalE [Endozoicomonas sp. OPT23]MRI32626.1 UDP-glucose 4-epimerase GalE [Endozoicomonas sp. OPT23]